MSRWVLRLPQKLRAPRLYSCQNSLRGCSPPLSWSFATLRVLYFLSLALRTIPIGIAYAIWSALGIVLISLIGYLKFRQALDIPAMVGVGLIVAGVVIANVFSKSIVH